MTYGEDLERERINADRGRARAKAETDGRAVERQGRAKASAIEAKARAMRESPECLKRMQAERWNGELPKTMVSGASVPRIKLGQPFAASV